MKTKFKRNEDGSCDISFEGMTQGKALALVHALGCAKSAVAEDIKISLRNAVQNANNRGEAADKDQQLFELFSC